MTTHSSIGWLKIFVFKEETLQVQELEDKASLDHNLPMNLTQN